MSYPGHDKLQGTYRTTGPIRPPLLPSVLSNDNPAASKKIHIRGKVCTESARFRSIAWKAEYKSTAI
jgi:hypothetical protein